MKPFLRSLRLQSFLSFPPDSPEIALTPLNMIIGPNGSGKSNLIEAAEILRSAPTDLAQPIREGGGVREWIWKGEEQSDRVTITAEIAAGRNRPGLCYRLAFAEVGQRFEVAEEMLAPAESPAGRKRAPHYHFHDGHASLFSADGRRLAPKRELFRLDQSIFSQRKDPVRYPELTRTGERFARIQTMREWSFGRRIELRRAQPTDLPGDELLPDARNLALLLNDFESSGLRPQLNALVRRFYPRFRHLSTKVQGGTIQVYLHEDGLSSPVSATRLSDGTLRFLALLAVLLRPENASLICIEEPELGLHPDALALIAELLVEASRRTQCIVTTHSDVLVSALSDHVESVLVCEQLGRGTEMRRLDSEKLRFWLDKYRLGELWRIGKLGGNLA